LATVDLALEFDLAAEVLALFGPSGAGKSMSLKMIAGIETPDRGIIRSGERVLFDSATGIDLPPQRRRAGYVPQQYALFPHLTALENVAYPLRKGLRWPTERANRRARELLESFGLGELLDVYPGGLSGGQQQRVALARALSSDPEILLLDEPFAALDGPIRAELRNELRALQQRLRVPAVFVTHDLEEAATLASRIAVMLDGSLRQIGSTRDVLDRPVDRQVAELVQARNIISGTIEQTEGVTHVTTSLGRLAIGKRAFADRAAVDLIIRPEVIRIVRENRPLDRLRNQILLDGSVTQIVDHGTRVVIYAAIRATMLEISLSPSAAARLDIEIGGPIRIAIAETDIHIVPALGS
ncbi:MAG TPA: ABC transporter ATP-binding protein, partial [Thermomicrobiales bacterium]|nr:ABC transporter ATP-binding protein [Thermomicrobiales bacterium]